MTADTRKRGGDAHVAEEDAAKPVEARKRVPAKRVVEIVFTPEQIAYLDERMRIVTEVRPMRRVGGSSLRARRQEGLPAN